MGKFKLETASTHDNVRTVKSIAISSSFRQSEEEVRQLQRATP